MSPQQLGPPSFALGGRPNGAGDHDNVLPNASFSASPVSNSLRKINPDPFNEQPSTTSTSNFLPHSSEDVPEQANDPFMTSPSLAEPKLVARHIWMRFRLSCRKVTGYGYFDGVMGLVVAANALCLAVESEISWADGQDTSVTNVLDAFKILDLIFLLIFTAELMARIIGSGFGIIAKNPAMWLDLIIVITGWITEIIFPLHLGVGITDRDQDSPSKVLQTLKVLRVLRAVRVLRMLTMFRDLWLVVQSFFYCLRPLMWTVLFILIIIFLFAMFAVDLIGKDVNDSDPEELLEVKMRLRSVVPAMVTLFQVMTLDEWFAICEPLLTHMPWTYAFFLVYIPISALALMNLVTAVVVESATRGANEEADYQQQIFDDQVAKITVEIREMFELMDEDGGGSLSEDEFVNNARKTKLLSEICDDFNLGTDEDLAQLFDILKKEHSDIVLMEDLLNAVVQLQRIAEDKVFVAAVRESRSPEIRMRHLQHALGKADNELTKLKGSVSTKFDRLYERIGMILRGFEELRIVLGGEPTALKAGSPHSKGSVNMGSMFHASSPSAARGSRNVHSPVAAPIFEEAMSSGAEPAHSASLSHTQAKQRLLESERNQKGGNDGQHLRALTDNQTGEEATSTSEAQATGKSKGADPPVPPNAATTFSEMSVENLEKVVEDLLKPGSLAAREDGAEDCERIIHQLLPGMGKDADRLQRVLLAAASALEASMVGAAENTS